MAQVPEDIGVIHFLYSWLMQRLRPHGLTLLLYTTLTFVSLDNLVLNFATAIPMDWDYAIFYWNLWWVKYALFNLHRDPMFSDYVLYPNTVNLSLHTLTFPLGLLTAPLQFLDLKLIYNGLMVGSFIATAYLTFLFLRRHIQNDRLAVLGGATFAFTPAAISHASAGHLNLAQAWWLPLELLLWDGIVARHRMRSRVIAAIGLGLASYLAWTHDAQFVLWIAPLLAPYALYTWFTQCRGAERLSVLGLALVAGAFTLGPALIEPIPAILQTRGTIFPRTDTYTLEYFSYHLEWLVIRTSDRFGESMGQMLPWLTLLCLPLAGRRRGRWLWFVLSLSLFVLSLGPYLPGTHIPLPYWLVHQLLGEQYRTPLRLATPAAFASVVFAALSLANLFERKSALRWQTGLVGVALVGLVFDSGMLAPFPVTYMPDYRVYHEIGHDPEEYTLLEVPVGPASGFGEFGDSPDLQYYAYIHHKRLINGIVSRLPSDSLSRYERSPLLRGLTGEYDFPPFDVASQELADKLQRWDMRYVLVHRDRLDDERERTIVQFLNVQPELCLVDEEGELLAYRRINTWADCPRPQMSALPAETTRLALGEPGFTRYIGPGWYDVENIGGPQARWAGEIPTSTLRVLLPKQDLRASFNAWAYPTEQSVTVRVNGLPVAHFDMTDRWQLYQFDIQANYLPDAGPTLIELVHTQLLSAAQRGENPDQRPLAAAYTWFEFTSR
jgi:hypothetical protein